MRTVRHLLNEKGSAVWAVSPDTPVFQALEKMAEKDSGAEMLD